MNKKIIGVVLLAAGGVLAYLGYAESQKLASQVAQVFTGSPTNKAMYFYIAAGVLGVAGLVGMLSKK